MGLETVHPSYADMEAEWEKMRAVFLGERHVKQLGTKYLKPTKAMILDGFYAAGSLGSAGVIVSNAEGTVVSGPGAVQSLDPHNVGVETYNAYRDRAIFPDHVREAVERFLGVLHAKDAVIELPAGLEPMRDNATTHGESLEMLLRRINTEQLITSRLGLLLDLPENPDPANPMPYIALYVAEAVRNWDDGEEGTRARLVMVVLDESGMKRDPATFTWQHQTKRRVLELGTAEGEPNSYAVGVFETTGAGGVPEYVLSDMVVPKLRGQPLKQIPFVFVNVGDVVSAPDQPILLGLANTCLAIYRGEADYRQNLFMQGQDTLVVKGDLKRRGGANDLPVVDEGPLRTGAGAMIHLESGAENDAKYIGVGASGLSEQRTALDNLAKRADGKAGGLDLTTEASRTAESGEALRMRVAARTASLNQLAKTGAAALQQLLQLAAEWLGLDPTQVKVTPNLEFSDWQMTGADLFALMQAQDAGAPLSDETIHALAVAGGLTELDYQTELAKITAERAEKQRQAQENAVQMAKAVAAAGGGALSPPTPDKPGQPGPGGPGTQGGGAQPAA